MRPVSYEVQTALIGLVAGAVSGGITALAAPWANWGVEKRRDARARRAALVKEWRAGIAQWVDADPGSMSRDFMTSGWFQSLLPHLSEDAKKKLYKPELTVIVISGFAPTKSLYVQTVMAEIDRIETKWELV